MDPLNTGTTMEHEIIWAFIYPETNTYEAPMDCCSCTDTQCYLVECQSDGLGTSIRKEGYRMYNNVAQTNPMIHSINELQLSLSQIILSSDITIVSDIKCII
eukprot:241137_1